MTTTNTTIEKKKPTDLKGWLNDDTMRSQFAAALPKHLPVDRFCRVAITALSRTPKLQECTQASFFKCLLDLSAMGLEPDGYHAHLIPYGKECTLIVDYKGIIALVRRDSEVSDVQCFTIRENDECRWVNGEMEHIIDPKVDRGDVVSTYTRIKWKNGNVSVGEPFSRDDAEKAKRSSKASSSGPWKDHYDEMWKKSNVRRDSKMWPLSAEIRDAIQREADHMVPMRDITPQRPALPDSNPFEQGPGDADPVAIAEEELAADIEEEAKA